MLIQLHVTKQYAFPMDIAHAVVLALANIYVHRTCDTHVCEYMYFAYIWTLTCECAFEAKMVIIFPSYSLP